MKYDTVIQVGRSRWTGLPKYKMIRLASSKYEPHQGNREKARRRRQRERGII